ncbi:MAG: putative Ig domain-containing protein, partial [Anaerolineae bacterium]|nr:putative Ig domain-containing protein [Anaerolineae bacterium]
MISNIAPIITSSNPPNGNRNVAYSYSFTASGTTPITYSVTSGSLPPGLTMNSAGVISGTPTTDGGYNATVTASNGGTPNATRSFTIVITSTPPSITSSNPVNGSRGVAYSHTFTANGTPTITFSRTSGTLPPGLTLSSAGVLSGTPTTNGTYTATVTASNGSSPSATQTFTIVISNL